MKQNGDRDGLESQLRITHTLIEAHLEMRREYLLDAVCVGDKVNALSLHHVDGK
jgi:hypothetical protein